MWNDVINPGLKTVYNGLFFYIWSGPKNLTRLDCLAATAFKLLAMLPRISFGGPKLENDYPRVFQFDLISVGASFDGIDFFSMGSKIFIIPFFCSTRILY